MKAQPLENSVLFQPPCHIAIIMDGNGRWAKARGLPRIMGHRQGAEAVHAVVKAAGELGISYLTLFGFSSENWKRPANEVSALMGLLRLYLKKEINNLHKNNVRLQVLGEWREFSVDIISLIEHAEALTKDNSGLTLSLALNYGGRQEIVRATRAVAEAVSRGEFTADELDEKRFSSYLFDPALPDPDLIIRTSGEQRLSNFLLWQAAYTEFVFVDTHWPDFSQADLEYALEQYQGRERRYGSVAG